MAPGSYRYAAEVDPQQSTWPYYALPVDVQPLTPRKSASGKLESKVTLAHFRPDEGQRSPAQRILPQVSAYEPTAWVQEPLPVWSNP